MTNTFNHIPNRKPRTKAYPMTQVARDMKICVNCVIWNQKAAEAIQGRVCICERSYLCQEAF